MLETSINGAKAILLNVMGGYDLGMLEINEIADQIEQAADEDAIVIFGSTVREDLQDEIVITVIATGFEERPSAEMGCNIGKPFSSVGTAPTISRGLTEPGSSGSFGREEGFGRQEESYSEAEEMNQEAEAAGMRPEEEGRPEAPEKPGLFEIPTFLNKGSFKGF